MAEYLKYWPVALFVLNIVILWAQWSVRHAFATKDDLAAAVAPVRTELQGQERRMSALEAELKHAPTHADLEAIRSGLVSVQTHVAGLSENVRGVNETLGRIERPLNLLLEHHLKEPKR
jgi:hypothetical protein